MLVSTFKLKFNTIVKQKNLIQNRNVLTTVKMNMDEDLNKGLIGRNDSQETYKIPGKIQLGKTEIEEREQKLKSLAENWKKQRISEEESSKELLGFTKSSEIINGRFAMFFLTTGLLTEIWTKQTMIDQIETMLRIVGLV